MLRGRKVARGGARLEADTVLPIRLALASPPTRGITFRSRRVPPVGGLRSTERRRVMRGTSLYTIIGVILLIIVVILLLRVI